MRYLVPSNLSIPPINFMHNASMNDPNNYDNESIDIKNLHLSVSNLMLIFIVVYMAIFIVGLCGNISVIYIIFKFPKMKTVTNLYILNLAVADIMFLIGIPFLVSNIALNSWPFGYFMCKVYWITAIVNQFVSSVFYMVLSGDRFVAVYLALTAARKYRKPFIAKVVCAGVWAFSTLVMIPIIKYSRAVATNKSPYTGQYLYSCQVIWPEPGSVKLLTKFDANKAFTLYSFLFGYGIPVLLTNVFYFFVLVKLKSIGPEVKKAQNISNPIYGTVSNIIRGMRNHVFTGVQHKNSTYGSGPDNINNRDCLSRFRNKKDKIPSSNLTEECYIKEPSYITSLLPSSMKENYEISTFKNTSNVYSKKSDNFSNKDGKRNFSSGNPPAGNSYEKRKKRNIRRVTSMVLTIITVYVCCWTPYWVMQLLIGFNNSIPPFYVSMFIYFLAYANSCVNPILYAFLSPNFKTGFIQTFNIPCFRNRFLRKHTVHKLDLKGPLMESMLDTHSKYGEQDINIRNNSLIKTNVIDNNEKYDINKLCPNKAFYTKDKKIKNSIKKPKTQFQIDDEASIMDTSCY
ncbi:unnamed protein product [Gordionus sp. m RMFG-2023]